MRAGQDLFDRLLELALAQNRALTEGRLEEAVGIMERRQELVSAVQKIDGSPPLEAPGINQTAAAALRRTLDVDVDSRTAALSLMNDVAARLESVRKMRALCRDLVPGSFGPARSAKV